MTRADCERIAEMGEREAHAELTRLLGVTDAYTDQGVHVRALVLARKAQIVPTPSAAMGEVAKLGITDASALADWLVLAWSTTHPDASGHRAYLRGHHRLYMGTAASFLA